MKTFLLIVLSVLALPVSAETITGKVTHVRDGDTIEVRRIPVRLNGLNCEESGTRLGNQATRELRKLLRGKTVTCKLNGDKSYDRLIGRCSVQSGEDIGAILIASGLCGRCARFDPRGTYRAAEKAAGRWPGRVPGYCRRR